jgi:hypothetical protein
MRDAQPNDILYVVFADCEYPGSCCQKGSYGFHGTKISQEITSFECRMARSHAAYFIGHSYAYHTMQGSVAAKMMRNHVHQGRQILNPST